MPRTSTLDIKGGKRMNYTKGEWTLQLAQPYDEHEFEITYDTEDGLTYTIADIVAFNGEDAEANAHLISAAPQLLEALNDLFLEFEHWTFNYTGTELETLRDRVRQALAKAEGK